ncbi:hypothetical protein H8B09_02635 [Paenibacillus sp. PR3]|uniref:YqbQ/XkdQ domain-containing protein n=1 Tax=Paenibacillus terricola TaxID=2763503 RepID=A0ABR8MPU7_9BACL|nr:hypothetical protein [Paenibacillus terricola]MBD3917635.1 hypothetical protein [Paenibacillus terricola]
MLEILIDNKNGRVWDVSQIAKDVSWKTVRVGKPSVLELSLVNDSVTQNQLFTINNGDVIRVRYAGHNVFYGYVFKLQQNTEQIISVTAYDQMRYLLNKDTYKFKNMETGDIIRKIAADFKLKTGTIDATGYSIPSMMEDGQTLLDIIEKANALTISNYGQFFVFFDDFGALSLRRVSQLQTDFYIGDGSLLTGYDYAQDIDSDTYNRIKLYRDNKETGKRDIYLEQDSANVAQWGMLQLYESIDENLNAAQIEQKLYQLAQLKNREQRTLSIDAIGDIRVRAGMYLPIAISALGIKELMLAEEVKHSFGSAEHNMTITLRVI